MYFLPTKFNELQVTPRERKTKVSKRVRISTEVQDIPNEYAEETAEEIASSKWFSRHELFVIRMTNQRTVQQHLNGCSRSDVRGLYTREELLLRRKNRVDARDALLQAQDLLRFNKVDGEELLADTYAQCCDQFRQEALERGRQDRKDIQDIVMKGYGLQNELIPMLYACKAA